MYYIDKDKDPYTFSITLFLVSTILFFSSKQITNLSNISFLPIMSNQIPNCLENPISASNSVSENVTGIL